jgi:hypothetical protein
MKSRRPLKNSKLMMEKQEIEVEILQCEIKLKDKVMMKLTEDEKMSYSNVWCTHCELTDGLKKSHGKITLCCLGNAHKC